MAATPPLTLKHSYRCVSSLQQFYRGGPFAVSNDGALLACARGKETNIVISSDASVLATFGGESEAATAFTFIPDSSVGSAYEAEHWSFRDIQTKANCFITMIDDVYDVHGTLDEIELFTDAIDR
ncbi:hypothetical protein Cni_G13309 [Canna indica]|uniref:Terpene synthase metal-binding domain-containing protein n=1 Tax=Canna indica TaxID=4628 RepID=A0AAQ3QCZ6_9LILI|nr:hypothetical protein Cni_G13309 [Canna indica]